MRERGWGRIVHVTGLNGIQDQPELMCVCCVQGQPLGQVRARDTVPSLRGTEGVLMNLLDPVSWPPDLGGPRCSKLGRIRHARGRSYQPCIDGEAARRVVPSSRLREVTHSRGFSKGSIRYLPTQIAYKYVTGATKSTASMGSRMPPWPGMIEPESLVPTDLFSRLSTKSPNCPIPPPKRPSSTP